MQPRSPHSLRFALVAAFFGMVWCGLVVGCPAGFLPEPWSDFQDAPTGLDRLRFVLAFVIGVLVPAWCFRRAFPPMRTGETILAAALALPLVVLCFTGALLAVSCLTGAFIESEESQEASTLLADLGLTVWFVLFQSAAFIAAALQAVLFFLPLCWFSILLLRWASGPSERVEPWTLRSARH
jgi:hypothetical protein